VPLEVIDRQIVARTRAVERRSASVEISTLIPDVFRQPQPAPNNAPEFSYIANVFWLGFGYSNAFNLLKS
jgi:hypothetical protein